MAKYSGKIGYIETVETAPGVWTEEVTEKPVYGDVTRNTRRWASSSEQLNDNLNIDNQISIVANPYAMQNFHVMRYIWFMGTKWKINNVEVQYPRLILSIGGVYNGEQDTTT